ncbi:MAG: PIN domain-containing protein [Clostridia bacterium]|nr:PIN domain-containing protein [Clostridia bacterium]
MQTRNWQAHWRKNMVLLIDTNLILDYLLKRAPFYDDAKRIMALCSQKDVYGYVALPTITNLWYILREVPEPSRRAAIKSICELLEVVGTPHQEVMNAIDTVAFKDFEDCIQSKCAKTVVADYIITRNTSDFEHSEIPVKTPRELIDSLEV